MYQVIYDDCIYRTLSTYNLPFLLAFLFLEPEFRGLALPPPDPFPAVEALQQVEHYVLSCRTVPLKV